MGEWVEIIADDGHKLAAYLARPTESPIGGLVVVQEIYGVNASIREVVDMYAAQGFVAIAPALFDRFEKDVQLSYSPEDMRKASQLHKQLQPDTSVQDAAAAFKHIESTARTTSVLGFCYGGLVSWLAATRGAQYGMGPACCVGYYPGGIGKFASEEPTCPVMLHFGAEDDHIGKDQVEAVRSAHPDVQVYTYEGAGHAFANAQRPSFRAYAAKLARERSLAFFKRYTAH